MKSLGWGILLIVIAVILIIGWLLWANPANGPSVPAAPGLEAESSASQTGAAPVSGEPGITLVAPDAAAPAADLSPVDTVSTATVTTTAPDAAQPKTALAGESAVLAAVAPYTGSGTATRSFDGTTFTHSVTAAIADPATGKFYEGWLVMSTPAGPEFFSTGKMSKNGTNYLLTYNAQQDYPFHAQVVITEETSANGLDGKPEAHVLEGNFPG